MANIDQVIQGCIDDIWHEYDQDGSGTLEKEECKAFVLNTIQEFTGQSVENLSLEEFDKTFAEFDHDENGKIDKHEMLHFIRRVAGLPGSRR